MERGATRFGLPSSHRTRDSFCTMAHDSSLMKFWRLRMRRNGNRKGTATIRKEPGYSSRLPTGGRKCTDLFSDLHAHARDYPAIARKFGGPSGPICLRIFLDHGAAAGALRLDSLPAASQRETEFEFGKLCRPDLRGRFAMSGKLAALRGNRNVSISEIKTARPVRLRRRVR